MTELDVTTEFSIGIGLLLLAVITKLLEQSHVDQLRNGLFSARDEMFLYAYENDLLDHQAYISLRMLANGMIRYAHKTSLAKILLTGAALHVFRRKPLPPLAFVKWNFAVEELPPNHIARMRMYHEQFLRLATTSMVARSPITWIVVLGVVLRLIVRHPTLKVIGLLRQGTSVVGAFVPVDTLEAAALAAAR